MAGKKPTKTREVKGRRKRRKMKLSLRSRSVKKTEDHRETAGWSKIQDLKQADEGPKQPEIIQHQCSLWCNESYSETKSVLVTRLNVQIQIVGT